MFKNYCSTHKYEIEYDGKLYRVLKRTRATLYTYQYIGTFLNLSDAEKCLYDDKQEQIRINRVNAKIGGWR